MKAEKTNSLLRGGIRYYVLDFQNFHPNEVVIPRSFLLAFTSGWLSKFSYRFRFQKRSFTSSTLKFELSPIRTRPGSVKLGQTRKRELMSSDLNRNVEKSSPTRDSAVV